MGLPEKQVNKKELFHVHQNMEAALMNLPQEDCPVFHRFGPGLYIREVHIPSGTMAVGHSHKKPHLNTLLKGKISMPMENGEIIVLEAPFSYVALPGRKIGYVLEDLVWQNIFATDETDIVKLEDMFLDKSENYQIAESESLDLQRPVHDIDREDFLKAITDFGFTPEKVNEISIDESDLIPFPKNYHGIVTVRESPINGKGIFCSSPFMACDKIVPVSIKGKRTPAGRYANHSINPNAIFIKDDHDVIWLVAKEDIKGSYGGSYGTELTVCYREHLLLQFIKTGGKCQL